jgi:hypothetical protein
MNTAGFTVSFRGSDILKYAFLLECYIENWGTVPQIRPWPHISYIGYNFDYNPGIGYSTIQNVCYFNRYNY